MDAFDNLSAAESAQLAAYVEQIDARIALGRMHPVVKDVLFLLHDERGQFVIDFSLARLQQLQTVIVATETARAAAGSLGLLDAVYDLFRIAAALWDVPAAKKAALVLNALLEKIVVDKNLMSVVKRDAEFPGDHLARAKVSIGDEVSVTAPRLGAAAPDGTVKADRLIPKRRI